MRINFIILAVAASLISACGGGGGTTAVFVPPSSSAPTTAPADPAPTPAPAAPVAKAPNPCSVAYWGDSISALTAPRLRLPSVTPHAVVGGTAQAALATFLQDPLVEQYIVIEYGTNEVDGKTPIEPALRSMLDYVKSKNRTAVLTGMPSNTAGDASYHATYNLIIANLSKEYGALYANWPGVAYALGDLMPDGVHPADVYQQRLADALTATIQSVAPSCK